MTRLTLETGEKLKEFYGNNKEVVISVSVAATVYFLMKEKKPKKEKSGIDAESRKKTVKRSVIKSFISERSESE